VTRQDRARLNRLQVVGLRVAAVVIRAAAFVICPGDDIAAAVLPAVHGLTGDADHGHEEQPAILPQSPRIVVRLPLDRDGSGPDPDEPPDLPVPPTDPAAYDLSSLYHHFVLEGTPAPGAAGSLAATAERGQATGSSGRGGSMGRD
jgi:hypothetical protein